MRISRRIGTAWLAVWLSAGVPIAASTTGSSPVFEASSSGLITFSGADAAIRVAVTFGERDEAVVPTLVRFRDARGNILKQQRGELREGQPVVAELTRGDVIGRGDLLVRIEVVHKLPGVRDSRYPILVTAQPIAVGGFGRFALDWNTGVCGCPTCGSTVGPGQHLDCDPTVPTDI